MAEERKIIGFSTDLAEIKNEAIRLLTAAESAESLDEKQGIEKDLEQAVNYFTAVSKGKCFDEAKNAENPMVFAIEKFFYPAIRIKVQRDKETGLITREIEDTEKNIDLGELHAKLGGIGADKQWINAVEKFNYHLTARAAQRVNAKVDMDKFRLKDKSKQFSLGANPCSNTQMLKTLQGIVEMMLGEGYKATSHDVNYLVDCYANDNKRSKTGVTLANHKTLRMYMKKVCYRILTGGKCYDVMQKEIKED